MVRPLFLAVCFCLFCASLALHAAESNVRINEQPAAHEIVNKAKDIRVISDRKEATADFFHRQHVVLGGLAGEEVTKLLEAKKKQEKVFINYASFNEHPGLGLYGASIGILPPAPAVVKLLAEQKTADGKQASLTLIFARDAKDGKSYRVVGFTGRTPVSFFEDKTKHEIDGISQHELLFQAK